MMSVVLASIFTIRNFFTQLGLDRSNLNKARYIAWATSIIGTINVPELIAGMEIEKTSKILFE